MVKPTLRYRQALSEYYKVLSGALPQGTKLGPIGFQVVINDAAHDLGEKIKCWKYVDDLTLAENRLSHQPSGLQVVLDEFNEWTNTNKLGLNPSKCQAILTCKKSQSKKANQKLYMLRLLKRLGFNDEELISIYKCYVRPVL